MVVDQISEARNANKRGKRRLMLFITRNLSDTPLPAGTTTLATENLNSSAHLLVKLL